MSHLLCFIAGVVLATLASKKPVAQECVRKHTELLDEMRRRSFDQMKRYGSKTAEWLYLRARFIALTEAVRVIRKGEIYMSMDELREIENIPLGTGICGREIDIELFYTSTLGR